MLGDCLRNLAALGPGGVPALALALFLAGLAAGATHCAGMCGPFVLAQVSARARDDLNAGALRRLAGAALLPYHAGRAVGYTLLGAVTGAAAGLLAAQAGGMDGASRPLLALPLLLAALLMLGHASSRLAVLLPRLPAPRLPRRLEAHVAALFAAPTGWRGVLLGFALSALPCGALYAALAGAAAAGSALGGALVMLAFVVGTVPALVGVGLLGRLFLRRMGPHLQTASGVLFALNAAVLTTLAARLAFA